MPILFRFNFFVADSTAQAGCLPAVIDGREMAILPDRDGDHVASLVPPTDEEWRNPHMHYIYVVDGLRVAKIRGYLLREILYRCLPGMPHGAALTLCDALVSARLDRRAFLSAMRRRLRDAGIDMRVSDWLCGTVGARNPEAAFRRCVGLEVR